MSKIISKEVEKNICEYYLKEPISLKEMSLLFSLSSVTISKILNKNSIKIYNRQDLYNKGAHEFCFKDIDNEEKAYFLGLLIADGCVFQFHKGQYSILLTLKNEDTYMVERFAQFIGTNRKILVDKRDNSKTAIITSNKMALDLSKYGVVEQKTDKTVFPIIPYEFYPALIRGIIDGDGNLGYRKRKVNANTFRWQIAIAGSFELLNGLKKFLITQLNVEDVKIIKEDNIYSIRWSAKKDFYKICSYIYKDSTIHLNRKYKVFQKFLELEM